MAQFLLTYAAGPVAALLPERWRRRLPLADHVRWERATVVSALAEITASIVAMGFWYMHKMSPMIGAGSESALMGAYHVEVTEHQVGGVALFVFALHPLTWLLALAFAEGGVRLLGAVATEEVRGTFPLYLLERLAYLAAHPGEAREVAQEVRRNVASIVETLRERVMVARLENVADELQYTGVAADEFLEIRACRRKEDWVAPKVARVDEVYYRLERSWVEKGTPRPFRYQLRRLEAGVPGRSVLLYKSCDAVLKE